MSGEGFRPRVWFGGCKAPSSRGRSRGRIELVRADLANWVPPKCEDTYGLFSEAMVQASAPLKEIVVREERGRQLIQTRSPGKIPELAQNGSNMVETRNLFIPMQSKK